MCKTSTSLVVMRELTYLKPGALEWREAPEPVLQEARDAIVRPVVATTCDLDRLIIQGKTPFPAPFALGHEFVAEVVDAAGEAFGVRPGQLVVVPAQISCGWCDRCRRAQTGSCRSVAPCSMYGLGPVVGDWGGGFSDLVRVPFADHMLVPVPLGLPPVLLASASENLSLAWETVAPHLLEAPGADVLIVGAGSLGLYAAAIAGALGASSVDYLDDCAERLALATSLGANPRPMPKSSPGTPAVEDLTAADESKRRYEIAVDARGDPEALHYALLSLQPGGVCTSVAMYFKDVPFPLMQMFVPGVRFHTGRGNARPSIRPVLDLLQAGRIRTDLVTSETLGWDALPEALTDPSLKPVFVRSTAGETRPP